jgi:hypothetical protein
MMSVTSPRTSPRRALDHSLMGPRRNSSWILLTFGQHRFAISATVNVVESVLNRWGL